MPVGMVWLDWSNFQYDARLAIAKKTYSLETLPFLYWNQSTFPEPTFHSSPKQVSNSVCVKPGGSLLTTSFSRGAGDLGVLFAGVAGFWVAEAGMGRTPADGLATDGCTMACPFK